MCLCGFKFIKKILIRNFVFQNSLKNETAQNQQTFQSFRIYQTNGHHFCFGVGFSFQSETNGNSNLCECSGIADSVHHFAVYFCDDV